MEKKASFLKDEKLKALRSGSPSWSFFP